MTRRTVILFILMTLVLLAGIALILRAPPRPHPPPVASPAPISPTPEVRTTPVPAVSTGVYTETTVARFNVGAGEQEFGVFPGGQDEPPRGPNVLALDSTGEIYVLDREKERLVTLNSEGAFNSALRLAGARSIVRLAKLQDGRFAAVDTLGQSLVRFDRRGKPGGVVRIPSSAWPVADIVPDSRTRLILSTTNVALAYDLSAQSRLSQLKEEVPQRGRPIQGGIDVSYGRSSQGDGRISFVSRSDASQPRAEFTVKAPVRGKLGSFTVLKRDSTGRLFMRLEVLVSTSPVLIRRFIQVRGPDLALIDTVEWPVEGVIPSDQDVQIDEQGRIFVLLSYLDHVEVRRYAPAP